MSFENNKKTFLEKIDKSKKGSIDQKALSLVTEINKNLSYYTTSSCSGWIYLWRGTGKKNETEWVIVSHEVIDSRFFELSNASGLIWLRFEPFIMHICCEDLAKANQLLEASWKVYKKSCLLSIRNKIIVEIRDSSFIEMPLYKDNKSLFSGDLDWLICLLNEKLMQNWQRMELFLKEIKKIS